MNIKKILKFIPLVLLALLPRIALAQSTLTQTSLAATVTGGPMGPISAGTQYQTTICLNSVTNILGQGQGIYGGPNQFQSALYIDAELMYVISVNTTSKCTTVLRAQAGTAATGHVTADMVLYGRPDQFFSIDPQGSCTSTGILVTPYVNVQNGKQWLCSSITGSWIPGFGNPGTSDKPNSVNTAVASVAGLTLPSGPLFHITGTNAITGWTIPVGCDATTGGGCSFCAIPDAIFTTTTANNIALASTAVVNKLLCWTWDGTNSKFVPSY